jgi:hypothetical protein
MNAVARAAALLQARKRRRAERPGACIFEDGDGTGTAAGSVALRAVCVE